ncbi:Ribosomal RNA-processing protein 8 [Vitis vinifera]|uniref:Ribosomal RNA-processing protein 8 n=1 Tax=Vitis vinifera TaxID=29760 RepID=A0A438H2A1_VITVI|nr:Ribosomal RNA-processing protein 8 [Vitis vinifera]
MRARLSGGHFRMINEKLYTCTGSEALSYFEEDPALFNVYHAGYQEQMSHWPQQPVNIIIKWLKDHSPSLIVADFGCGDARLARNVKNKVSPLILSQTPLESSSIDVAVFCLSLMGLTSQAIFRRHIEFLNHEVKSRFDPSNGGADPNRFSKAICKLGFTLESKDFSNKMFILLYFKKRYHSLVLKIICSLTAFTLQEKQNSKVKEIDWPELKPCLYKRR